MYRTLACAFALLTPTLAAADVPVIELSADGPNPQWITVDVPATELRGKELKLSKCDKSHVPHWFTATPVLHIDQAEGAPRMRIKRGNAGNYALRKPNGRYACTKKGKDINVKPVPGRWSLYLYSVKETKPARKATLAVIGLERDVSFPKVAVSSLGAATDKPIVLKGKALTGRRVAARRKNCAGLMMSAEPDAVVDLEGGLSKVRFDLSIDDPAAKLVVARLGSAKKLDLDCTRKTKRVFRLSTGEAERWGAWIVAPTAAAGTPWTITLSHGEMAGGSTLSTTEKRDDMPIAERVLSRHFPNLPLAANRLPTDPAAAMKLFDSLWEAVDRRLVVYSTGSDGYQPDEVLLPLSGGKVFAFVVNLEGVQRKVPVDRLKRSSDAPFVPAEPRATLPWQLLGNPAALKAWTLPKDHGAIDTFVGKVAKFDACFKKAFRAVDSTGKAYDYNLVTYRDGKVVKVENWGSKVAKKAARKCRAGAIERARDAFEKRMKASFKAWRTQRLAALAGTVRAKLKSK